MGDKNCQDIFFPVSVSARVMSLKVEVGSRIQTGTLIATYSLLDPATSGQDELCLRSSVTGRVSSIFCKEGATIEPNEPVCNVEVRCDHSIVVFDMCADCGQDLRRRSSSSEQFAQPESEVRVIHGMPELRVSQKEAEALGKKDYLHLLSSRKLALIVDLDQTLVHTSMDPNVEPGLPDVYGFHLPDHPLLYHCRLRPFTRDFLARVAKLYELHVFTMGTKTYAASVTNILDPEHKFFSDRIISRDECFDPHSKALRLKSLFPCGDSLVAIIDDREDVWGRSPNLIHVKPYLFFAGTADINAPLSSHRSRRHLKRLHPHHRQVGAKGYSLSNPLPFKTRHVVRQPMKNTANNRHSVSNRIPEGAAEPCKGEGEEEVTQENVKRSESTEQYSDLPVTTQEDQGGGNLVASTGEANISMASNEDDSNDVQESLNVSTCRGSDDDIVLTDEQKEGRELGVASQGGASGEERRSEQQRALEVEEAADMSIEAPNEDQGIGSEAPSTDAEQAILASTSAVVDHSSSSSSSSSNGAIKNNNNNNNNNNLTGDGVSKDGNGSDSDSSSDSSSSNSSSGIDDTLFDPAAHEGGDEGEEGTDASLVSGQNGVTENSGDTSASSAVGVISSVTAGTMSSSSSLADRKPGTQSTTPKPVVEIKDPDAFLLQLADILERVHTIFYEQYDNIAASEKEYKIPDLKQIIPELRHSILKDCRILFTGVIPTNAPPRKNAEWRTARAFGATIHTELVAGLDSSNEEDVSRATTHIIAGKPGTTKLLEASKLPGVKIVSPRWLWACAEQWKKANEADYPLDFPPKGKKRRSDRGNGPPCKKKSTPEVVATKVQVEDGDAGEVTSIEGLRRSFDEAADPELSLPAGEEDSDSDSGSSDDDDIFKNSAALNTLAKMDTTELKRHLSMESRLSVSDEELVRMDAEVEAEISESSSSSSNDGDEEGLGSQVEVLDNNDELSYENFAGTDDSDDLDSVMQERRKRKFEDIEGSSSSEGEVPVVDSLLNESLISDEDFGASKSGEEDDDELSKLLGF